MRPITHFKWVQVMALYQKFIVCFPYGLFSCSQIIFWKSDTLPQWITLALLLNTNGLYMCESISGQPFPIHLTGACFIPKPSCLVSPEIRWWVSDFVLVSVLVILGPLHLHILKSRFLIRSSSSTRKPVGKLTGIMETLCNIDQFGENGHLNIEFSKSIYKFHLFRFF